MRRSLPSGNRPADLPVPDDEQYDPEEDHALHDAAGGSPRSGVGVPEEGVGQAVSQQERGEAQESHDEVGQSAQAPQRSGIPAQDAEGELQDHRRAEPRQQRADEGREDATENRGFGQGAGTLLVHHLVLSHINCLTEADRRF